LFTADIAYLKTTLPTADPEFFNFLSNLTVEDIKIYAIDEGSVVFPRVPLLRVEGPLIVAQLLETTLLTLVNYASLVATNATRYRIASGPNIQLLEFGLRRAQGPDGGLSASKYSYMGKFCSVPVSSYSLKRISVLRYQVGLMEPVTCWQENYTGYQSGGRMHIPTFLVSLNLMDCTLE